MRRGPAHPRRPSYCGATRTPKIRYRSMGDATAAKAAREEAAEVNLRVYACECGGYHLAREVGYYLLSSRL